MKGVLLALLLLVAGCVSEEKPGFIGSHIEGSQPEYITWNANISGHEKEWSDEAARRFHIRPIVVVCHGGVNQGEWWMYPDAPLHPARVQDVAQTLHAVYPGRYILLICCNEGRVPLHVPGVWYCRKFECCWSGPGKDWGYSIIDLRYHEYAGKIEDFEEGK